MSIQIKSQENEIVGNWKFEQGVMFADESATRIDTLIRDFLLKIAESNDGWTVLYIDPADNRYWELSYPNSGSHGGGAPFLRCVLLSQVMKNYPFINP